MTVIREAHNSGKELNIVSIDLVKAFDTVNHTSINRALCMHGLVEAAVPPPSSTNKCVTCSSSFSTFSGLQRHRKKAHPDAFGASCSKKTKARWSEDEIFLLAKLEAGLHSACKNIKQVLVKRQLQSTPEAKESVGLAECKAANTPVEDTRSSIVSQVTSTYPDYGVAMSCDLIKDATATANPEINELQNKIQQLLTSVHIPLKKAHDKLEISSKKMANPHDANVISIEEASKHLEKFLSRHNSESGGQSTGNASIQISINYPILAEEVEVELKYTRPTAVGPDGISMDDINLFIDEMIGRVQACGPAYDFQSEKICILALADDMTLIADSAAGMKILKAVCDFLAESGMSLNTEKCRTICISKSPRSRRTFVNPSAKFSISDSKTDTFCFLSYTFDEKGRIQIDLEHIRSMLSSVRSAPLKPEQKVALIQSHPLPRLQFQFLTAEGDSQKATLGYFPNTRVHGCYFHFSKAIHRKVGELKLNRNSKRSKKKDKPTWLLATTFLPVPQVDTDVSLLEAGTTGNLSALFQYFRQEWMTDERLSLWNVRNVNIRTNNYLEGWHNQLNRKAAKSHNGLYELLQILIAEQGVMDTLIQQVLSGNATVGDLRRVNKVYAEKQQRVANIRENTPTVVVP
ncbi:Retrovirus-related Pol polyprotein from type-1 retrotransposable element [Trichinella nativa]|uniref:Retrovirus-related Pol polyprotein from type-1 retrotransposable element n=1 Tax=Trichinella nativa TaxID=6335 RepID=A0A0V1LA70_9BILA|nr:Retrovirus-related Pol polyprotein from type-1 retrotransposable element [Trichinella nativa]